MDSAPDENSRGFEFADKSFGVRTSYLRAHTVLPRQVSRDPFRWTLLL
jgi:hypothetical protein